MLYIKKFIDKISYLESKQSKDLVMPLSEARMVRDELAKLVLDMLKMKNIEDQVIEVKLKGGSFK
jgi:hypothetical protein